MSDTLDSLNEVKVVEYRTCLLDLSLVRMNLRGSITRTLASRVESCIQMKGSEITSAA